MSTFSRRWKSATLTAACLIMLLATSAPASSWASFFPDEWDGEFKDAVEIFLPPGTDWRLLKAQCWQESRLNPFAVSPVGARGLCQFMPGTAKEVGAALDQPLDAFWLPEVSIEAAAYYMGKLHRTWSAPRPAMDRYMVSAASYNAGAGHLIKAQRICGGGNLYKQIIPCLPQVTGRHSKETIDYVENIVGRWWPAMLLE